MCRLRREHHSDACGRICGVARYTGKRGAGHTALPPAAAYGEPGRTVITAISRSARATMLLVRGLITAGPAALGIFPALFAWLACATFVGLPWLPSMVRPLRELAGMGRRRATRVPGRPASAARGRPRGPPGAAEEGPATARAGGEGPPRGRPGHRPGDSPALPARGRLMAAA